MIKLNGKIIEFGTRPPEERRASRRHRVLKGGVISFNSGFSALECVVRNLSEGGAKLAFGGNTLPVPTRFKLRIGPVEDWREVRMCWRGVSEVGVAFVAG